MMFVAAIASFFQPKPAPTAPEPEIAVEGALSTDVTGLMALAEADGMEEARTAVETKS